jgi:hypothetical protein
MRSSLIIALIALAACQPSQDRALIVGHWKTDSVYRYYNGFSQTLREAGGTWSRFEYYANGKIRERRGDEYHEYLYEWKEPDSLIYRSPEGEVIGQFQLLELGREALVLKKSQPLLFGGAAQERYEIRYFSPWEGQP